MYLSKLVLNTGNAQVRQDLGNPHKFHRTIMRAFPFPIAKEERVLFRIENFERGAPPVVLVQSLLMPNWGNVEKEFIGYFSHTPGLKAIEGLEIITGDLFRFRLRANPTRRVLYKSSNKYQRISLFAEQDRKNWLIRKARVGGFSLIEDRLMVSDAPYRTFFLSKDDTTHKATINMVDFNGVLKIEYPEKFLTSIRTGIGPAKGLGCGLLSLARP